MSLDIRWFTNGEKSVIRVRNAGVTPVLVEYFDKPEDVDWRIRHYVPKKPELIGPCSAGFYGVRDILYPNFPECKLPTRLDDTCFAEHCSYCDGAYETCQYFGDNFLH